MDQQQLVILVLVVLVSISEVLDAIPSVKANSIWKAVRNIIYAIAKKPLPEDNKTK